MPPRKLFISVNAINHISPGTVLMILIVPRTSTFEVWSSEAAMAGSLSRMNARWTMANAVQTTARSTTYTMPAKPISSPLITEVTRYETPMIEPTRPFARSRRSAGTSKVTVVDMAMLRMLPAITASINTITKTQSSGSAGSVKCTWSTVRKRASARL